MMPVAFLSHGAPPLADDPLWTAELAAWGQSLPRPRDILMISAHWEAAPPLLSSTSGAPLLYDFWGFPDKYYDVTYAAPPATALADDVARLLAGEGVTVGRDESRGLDHGAYVPLVEMYPDADVPVVQLSLPTLRPEVLFALGGVLAPLRDQGTLIIGSGFTTHNLREFRPSADPYAVPPAWSSEFDAWAREVMAAKDVDALVDFARRSPNAAVAHPRTEHFAPLFVALGAAYARSTPEVDSVVDGFWYGLSKRSWQLS